MAGNMELGAGVSDGWSPGKPAKVEVQTLHREPTRGPDDRRQNDAGRAATEERRWQFSTFRGGSCLRHSPITAPGGERRQASLTEGLHRHRTSPTRISLAADGAVAPPVAPHSCLKRRISQICEAVQIKCGTGFGENRAQVRVAAHRRTIDKSLDRAMHRSVVLQAMYVLVSSLACVFGTA
jgi:hypothetical protein